MKMQQHIVKATLRLLLCTLLLLAATGRCNAQPPADENTLKALFVVKMCLFVQWDFDSSSSAEADSFVLGVLGDEKMVEVFQKLVQETSIQALPVSVEHVTSYDEAIGCSLLYIDHPIDSYIEKYIEEVGDQQTLLIDAYSDRVRLGSHFGLKLVEDHIRFDANYTAIQSSGLEVDYRLIQLADRVIGN